MWRPLSRSGSFVLRWAMRTSTITIACALGPVMAVLAGKLSAHRSDCAPVAGKSTLNRLELSRTEPTRYHRISHDRQAIEALFVDMFSEAQPRAPVQINLDLDATDDPLHGHQGCGSSTGIMTPLPRGWSGARNPGGKGEKHRQSLTDHHGHCCNRAELHKPG